MNPTLADIKRALEEALTAYRAIEATAPAADVRAASDKVKGLRAMLSDAITEGAKPCPHCDVLPHGMEQPVVGDADRTEFEVGCLGCAPYPHVDGTMRDHRVRGGLLPKHAVEAWNAGPDFWMKSADQGKPA